VQALADLARQHRREARERGGKHDGAERLCAHQVCAPPGLIPRGLAGASTPYLRHVDAVPPPWRRREDQNLSRAADAAALLETGGRRSGPGALAAQAVPAGLGGRRHRRLGVTWLRCARDLASSERAGEYQLARICRDLLKRIGGATRRGHGTTPGGRRPACRGVGSRDMDVLALVSEGWPTWRSRPGCSCRCARWNPMWRACWPSWGRPPQVATWPGRRANSVVGEAGG
jgi:hypothetical protein